MEAAIEVKQLRYRWPRSQVDVLNIADLKIMRAEQVFFHGESGSGKSTLLGILAGVLVPYGGSAHVLGCDLARLSGAERDHWRGANVGVIFQQFNLVPYLGVVENVLLPCRFSRRRRERASGSTRDPRGEAQRLLRALDLEEALWRRPALELSVGQQQRVAAARALIGSPELIIADEPTSALDAARQALFVELLGQEVKRAGSTLVFVSHDRKLAPLFSRSLSIDAINNATQVSGAA
jgi:putative ABC transport system ATP-binding protein